jgi:hypothetical protein
LVRSRRIGTAPSLSLAHVPPQAFGRPSHDVIQPNGAPPKQHATALPDRNSFVPGPLQFNTAPSTYPKGSQPGADEFGYGVSEAKVAADVKPVATVNSRTNAAYADETSSQPSESRPSVTRRTTSSSGPRFTITNIGEEDHELHVTPKHTNRAAWLSAEEEKKKLYEEANAKVAQVQGGATRESPPIDQAPVCLHKRRVCKPFTNCSVSH